MQKVWTIRPRTVDNLVEQLLANRGIARDDAAAFLQPEYGALNDPFLFRDMRKACDRIWEAIAGGEKIVIYSDYDADAITANAVVFRMLKTLGADVSVYIPDRFSEGYGLNLAAFEGIAERGAAVVITVDCGTNSVDEAAFCAEHGIDLIITDHHELTGPLPDAFAVINPKNPDDAYPYRELVGVGVAFKLACGVLSYRDMHELPEGYEKWYLDLVAIGTVADCHSLIGENRTLVSYGLKVLPKTKWIGLRLLLQSAREPYDTYTLGFVVAPRINAAGRIEHASLAFDLLTTDDAGVAADLAAKLEALNSRRQVLTENVMSEAREQLELIRENKVLLAAGTDWPKGVVGLVAGKLVEEFARPVLVLERGEVESTGSARSLGGFNMVEALGSVSRHLVRYGGHAAAAGFTLLTENVDAFYRDLLAYADENADVANFAKILDIEAELAPAEVSPATLEILRQLQPFGVDNRAPIFLLSACEVLDFGVVGKEGKHLQLTVRTPAGSIAKCIAFGFGRASAQLEVGAVIDLAFELIDDSWNGTRRVKLRVVDFRKHA